MVADLTNGMELTTVNGQTIIVDLSDGVKINDAKVTTADLEATNGVIHVIDKVLVPENFKLQVVDMNVTQTPKTGTLVVFPSLLTTALTAAVGLFLLKRKEA